MKYKQQEELVAGLRELADFVEQHIELSMDCDYKLMNILYTKKKMGTAKEQMKKAVLALGKAEKVWGHNYLDVRRKFGPITLEFSVAKSTICEKKVVGTKHHEAEYIQPWTEEIVEYECTESILA